MFLTLEWKDALLFSELGEIQHSETIIGYIDQGSFINMEIDIVSMTSY